MLSGPATEPAGNERMALMTSLSVTDTALNVNGSGTTERFTEAGGCRWRSASSVTSLVSAGFSSE